MLIQFLSAILCIPHKLHFIFIFLQHSVLYTYILLQPSSINRSSVLLLVILLLFKFIFVEHLDFSLLCSQKNRTEIVYAKVKIQGHNAGGVIFPHIYDEQKSSIMGNLLEINKKNIKSISQKCSHILETELATYGIFGYPESAGISCSTLKNKALFLICH